MFGCIILFLVRCFFYKYVIIRIIIKWLEKLLKGRNMILEGRRMELWKVFIIICKLLL